MQKARRLRDVKVNLISILTDTVNPSNRQKVIVKSDNHFKLDCEVEKSDEVKGLLYVTPMKALYADTDDEYYENDDVEKAAHEFMKSGTEGRADNNHNFEIEKNVFVVESYVEKCDEGYEWKAVLDISENEKLMEKARAGTITGVSIAGQALVDPADNPTIRGGEDVAKKIDELTVDIVVTGEEKLDAAILKAKTYNVELEKTISLIQQLTELEERNQVLNDVEKDAEPEVVEDDKNTDKVSIKIKNTEV